MRNIRAVNKPMLNRAHQRQRVEFARKFLRFNWAKTIFSDEKIFRVRPGSKVRCAP